MRKSPEACPRVLSLIPILQPVSSGFGSRGGGYIQNGYGPDAEYASVSEFFQGKELVDLTFAIAQINVWNRLGIAFGVEWRPKGEGSEEHG